MDIMKLVLACHQVSFSSNKYENLNRILNVLEETEAQLHVFPEYSMGIPPSGLTPIFVKENAECLEGKFVNKILEKTREQGLAAVFTTFLKEGEWFLMLQFSQKKAESKHCTRRYTFSMHWVITNQNYFLRGIILLLQKPTVSS